MNCAPGDLAVVVSWAGSGLSGEVSRALVGAVVTVTHLRPPKGDMTVSSETVWNFREPVHVTVRGRGFTCLGLADPHLQPIRGAEVGEDRSAQTLQLPVRTADRELGFSPTN